MVEIGVVVDRAVRSGVEAEWVCWSVGSFGVVVWVAVVDSEVVGPSVDCDDERDARDEGDGAGGGVVCAAGEENDVGCGGSADRDCESCSPGAMVCRPVGGDREEECDQEGPDREEGDVHVVTTTVGNGRNGFGVETLWVIGSCVGRLMGCAVLGARRDGVAGLATVEVMSIRVIEGGRGSDCCCWVLMR